MGILQKPARLKAGDTVATVSLSWGGAGDADIRWRYEQGKQRLQEVFGLRVIEMPHTLAGTDFVYQHPERRAQDLMDAFKDPAIKGVFSCIGGSESVRMLPYIDFDVIKNNPKVFMGYSDTTVSHFICAKAGLSSFYGPSILAEFAENVQMMEYTAHWVKKVLFDPSPIGEIPSAPIWTSEYLPWEEQNRNIQRKTQPNTGYELLQGKGVHRGHLVGGCIEVLEMIKGTSLWPDPSVWEGAILFFETSEEKPEPNYVEYWLRNYATQGILQKAKALLVGKPYDNRYYEEYKAAIRKVVCTELGLFDLPVLYNMSFGHTAPMSILPMGVLAEVDCERRTFAIVEAGVL